MDCWLVLINLWYVYVWCSSDVSLTICYQLNIDKDFDRGISNETSQGIIWKSLTLRLLDMMLKAVLRPRVLARLMTTTGWLWALQTYTWYWSSAHVTQLKPYNLLTALLTNQDIFPFLFLYPLVDFYNLLFLLEVILVWPGHGHPNFKYFRTLETRRV